MRRYQGFPLLLSGWLGLGVLASGQESRGSTPVTMPPPELPPLLRFEDPALFTRSSANIGFDLLAPGSYVDEALGVYGLRLRLGLGRPAVVWEDGVPREYPPAGVAALRNYGVEDLRAAPRTVHRKRDTDCALVATFEVPVNRVGFELRRVDSSELNVIVRCLSGGVELGQQFFDVTQGYRFVGLQCALPFDEVRIDFTNPAQALFSLDNVRHELDATDTDHDGWPDFADVCPTMGDTDQRDSDGDGLGDACDPFIHDPDNDADGDGFGGPVDNCPTLFNPDQADADHDGIGDACDGFSQGNDQDNDGVADDLDNCPQTFNPEQADCDLDGIGDICDTTLVTPAAVSLTLPRGGCVSITKSLCLPPAPPVVDVVIAFDTTGSMGGEIQAMRENIVDFVNDVRTALPLSDIRFGLVTFRDYPGQKESCGYAGEYARSSDSPFAVEAPIGTPDSQLIATINALEAAGGQDQPEAYARALWEIGQPDSGIGFRPGAARFVVLVGDAPPHDCNVGWGIGSCMRPNTTGIDPGRDEIPFTADDIDWHDGALRALANTHTTLLAVFSAPYGFCAWQAWCEAMGGVAIHAGSDGRMPADTILADELVQLILDPRINRVSYSADNPCGLQVTFDPPLFEGPFFVAEGGMLTFQETICVPPDLPVEQKSLDCEVRIFGDDNLLAVQEIHIDVACTMSQLDFETEDDFVAPLLNGQAISSPPEFGRLVSISSAGDNLGPAIFDSTPGGPNDPSPNYDLLIGYGNLLLLQDSGRPRQSVPGYFDVPVDDADGGDLIFSFAAPLDPHSVLLADINPPPNQGASVTLVDEGGRTRVYTVQPGWTGPYGDAGPWRLDLRTLQPQPGNGTPRWATAVEDQGFLQTRVVRIVVHLTGYGAMDELTFCR